jgi:two-component system nitrogen regulation response regulator GlnG
MKEKDRLLVVDDDPLTLNCFSVLFPKGRASVATALSAADGLKLFAEHRPDVVVLDVRLPDLSGLKAFRRFQEVDAKVPIILITGHGTAETAIEAMRLGAYDYVLKPIDPDSLRDLIERAFEISRLVRVPAKLVEPGPADEASDILVGNCPAMQEVYKAIGRVAPQDVTVLIRGESGTGKELVARAIYHYSERESGPFLAINCAAIPEPLLESELFGHEKGAFTGADRKRIGKFEQCNGGTLFLDEIGDMTPLTQTKVLRVLQNRQFERVGGNEVIQTDVRIIAATNQDLEARVVAGKYRRDLYYRLNVFTIRLPPLSERGDDLPLLARHFLRRFSQELAKDVQDITPEALGMLSRYAWPGNVRELQSVLKQAILQATGPVLVRAFFPAGLRGEDRGLSSPDSGDKADFPDLERFVQRRLEAGSTNLQAEFQAATEHQLYLQVLRHTDSNLTHAARTLGISRATLRHKLTALGIKIERSSSIEENESG